MKIVLYLCLCAITYSTLFGQGIWPRSYVAAYTYEAITIDGHSEHTWDLADWSDDFVDIEGAITPKYRTQVKMLWDSTYLYFFAKLEEPHVWADVEERDAVIFHNNDFEIFIDPDGDTHDYMEFEINALNTVWDLYLTKPYRNRPQVIDNWDIKGLQTAIKVDGTLNDPKDVDKCWAVEVAMPWHSLMEADKGKLPAGRHWRINFSRVNWDFELREGKYLRKRDDHGGYLPEYNWVWSPQYVVNMHEPEHWGYVYFALGDEKWDIPSVEILRYRLYEIYRRLLSAEDLDLNHLTINVVEQEIPVHFQSHKSGWNLWAKHPVSGHVVLIKEDGQSIIQSADE